MNDYEMAQDFTEAEKYENGWLISSNDAKKLFMARIVECAEDVVQKWNAISEITIDADKFLSMIRMEFGWMNADYLHQVKRINVVYTFSCYICSTFKLGNMDEIKEFFNKTQVEFWAGLINYLKYDNGFVEWNQATVVMTKILSEELKL